MSWQPSRRPATCTALTFASVVLLCILSPAARAGCGHGVTSSSQQRLMDSLFVMRISTLADPGELSPEGRAPRSPWSDGPCSGPGCSNRSFPSDAPPSFELVLDEDWGLGAAGPELAPRGQSRVLPHALRLTPTHASTLIDRPPRGR